MLTRGAGFLVRRDAGSVSGHANIATCTVHTFAFVGALADGRNTEIGCCAACSAVASPCKSWELSGAVCVRLACHAVQCDVDGSASEVCVGTRLSDGTVLWKAEGLV